MLEIKEYMFQEPSHTTAEQHATSIEIHFIGPNTQAAREDDMIAYLENVGWRILGISQEAMAAALDSWQTQRGVLLHGVDLVKAEHLRGNLQRLFISSHFQVSLGSDEKAPKTEIETDPLPAEIHKWLTTFTAELATETSYRSASHLCQLGVEDPHHCDCEFFEDAALGWLHRNHQRYNSMVWNILREHESFDLMRQEFEQDVTRSIDDVEIIATPPYGQELLDNFLTPTPNPTWVKQ